MNTLDPNKHEHAALIESLRQFALKHGYNKPIQADEARAIRRVQIIGNLGFTVTPAMIERELKLTRDTNVRVAKLVTGDLTRKTIKLME